MEQLTLSLDDYAEVKHKIKEKLNETVHNFIIIGYYLKQVKNSGAFRKDGYRSMEEFARAEYGLSAGTASRFMDINTEFSKNGDSPEIKEEYSGFAYSKLQEMLTVTPEDRELVTEHTTVQQIREIKQAEKEEKKADREREQKNMPLMQMAAPDNLPGGAGEETGNKTEPFEDIMTAFWKENAELYIQTASGMLTPEIAAEEICPSGSRTYRKGTNMLFFYDFDKGLKLRSYTDGKPVITAYTYQEFLEKTADMDPAPAKEKDEHQPEKPVATSQYGQAENAANNEAAEETQAEKDTVIDGEYRELESGRKKDGEKGADGQRAGYTDDEIKHAINYFDTEHSRMAGLGQDSAKRRNYKIALECICRCYKSIAEEMDRRE